MYFPMLMYVFPPSLQLRSRTRRLRSRRGRKNAKVHIPLISSCIFPLLYVFSPSLQFRSGKRKRRLRSRVRKGAKVRIPLVSPCISPILACISTFTTGSVGEKVDDQAEGNDDVDGSEWNDDDDKEEVPVATAVFPLPPTIKNLSDVARRKSMWEVFENTTCLYLIYLLSLSYFTSGVLSD